MLLVEDLVNLVEVVAAVAVALARLLLALYRCIALVRVLHGLVLHLLVVAA
jgi:hypothetical protein